MPLEADDIRALAQQLKDLQPAVGAVSIKLPPFWTDKPEVWFAQVEAQFATRQPPITADDTKYNHIISSLDNSMASEVSALIVTPPPADKYDSLKKVLIKAFGKTEAQKDAELLNLNGLGDRKPTALLRHIRSLNSKPETLLKAVFLAQLPLDARRILAASPKTDLDDLAEEADKIVEAGTLYSYTPPLVSTINSSSTSTSPKLCYFHTRFGDRAKNCKGAPCPKHHLVNKDKDMPGNDPADRQ